MSLKALSQQEKDFALNYLRDQKKNAFKAAVDAGYAESTAKDASKWLNPKDPKKFKPKLKEYLDEKFAEIESEKTADAKEVLEYLTSVMRGEHTEQTLKLSEAGGQDIVDISVSEKDRLKAAELIGKRYGLFKENVDIGGADTAINIKIDYGDENGNKDTG